MKRICEAMRNHPNITGSLGGTIVMAAILAGFIAKGYSQNEVVPVPDGSCLSPFADSKVYQNPEGDDFSLYSGLGEGVVLSGKIPGARGVRAAFKHGQEAREWTISDMVPVDQASGRFSVKLAASAGKVVFGIQAAADATQESGRAICAQPPKIDEKYYESGFAGAEGVHPWPNWGNVVLSMPSGTDTKKLPAV